MKTATKKPRPLHFADRTLGFAGETMCGKDGSRVRMTALLSCWDNPTMAGGRRCPQCAPGVEAVRKNVAAQVKP